MPLVQLPDEVSSTENEESDSDKEVKKFRSACNPKAAPIVVQPKKRGRKRPAAAADDGMTETVNMAASCPKSATDPLAPAGSGVQRERVLRKPGAAVAATVPEGRLRIEFCEPRETLGQLGCSRCRQTLNGCGTLKNPGCRQSSGWRLLANNSWTSKPSEELG